MLLTPIMEASEKLLFCFFVYGDDLSLYKLNTFFLNTENKHKHKKGNRENMLFLFCGTYIGNVRSFYLLKSSANFVKKWI